jgi:putative flippase GtrA
MDEIVSRLAERRTAVLLGRNTVASFATFALDILLLWLLVEFAGIVYLAAATIAYLIAITVHYALSRVWVFPRSERGMATGYFYFLVNAGIGLVAMLAMLFALVELAGLFYLVARAISSVVSGVLMFLLNAVFNFKTI